ncbi:MAG: hypothetical protein SPL13_06230 [Clostridia bacterium]|nr:hypothetical protein [Clostridia bacterium]
MSDFFVEDLKIADVGEYRSIPFWSWNSKLEPEELVSQIKWMKDCGFGGFFMHARGGLITEYLSDDWFKCIDACVDAAKKYGLDAWAYDENGWPSGFAGGKLLEDENNRDKYLTYEFGKFDKNALVSYKVGETTLRRVKTAGQGEYLNVYEHTATSTADILNGEVVDKFIALTHEEYKKRLGAKFKKDLSGFFTDEPQYYRWGHPYTVAVKKYFAEVYKEDILDGLGLLFSEKKGYRAFRYKYWLAMQTLMLENFAKKIYNWCENNGVSLTGHYIEETTLENQMICCAGIMPFYQYEHIPGMDKLGRTIDSALPPRQVSSVARQTGKKRVITETFALCGWDVTPKELKRIAEWQYVGGVNVMCQHLLPYSETGERKRDYPAHFSWVNPWVRKDFKSFNDYFARLGYLLGESEEPVSVAVFNPIRSMYFDYKRDSMGKNYAVFGRQYADIDGEFIALVDKLASMNIPFHIVDETVMEDLKASATDGKLTVGKCTYDYVVFPKVYTMGSYSAKLFEKMYEQGGKLLFTYAKPTYLEGEKHSYKFATGTSLKQISDAQPYKVITNNKKLNTTYRIYKGKKYIYAVNLDEEKPAKVSFEGDFHCFYSVNLEDLTEKKVSKTLTFEPMESKVLFLSNEFCAEELKENEIVLKGRYEVVSDSGNYMLLDKVCYSKDGVSYSKPLSYMGIFNTLLTERYEGDLYLKYTFTVKDRPKNISFIAENVKNSVCTLNGKKLVFDGVSDFDKGFLKADISRFIKKGENEIVQKIRFFESEKVYYALFGENVTESLKNCLVYDTTIEAGYLFGDFGVYEEKGFTKGKEKNVLIGEKFYIGKKKKYIYDTVKDGYPFFAGNITLKKSFVVNDDRKILRLKGRFHLADVKVNDIPVKKGYFDDKVNLEGVVRQGENVAEITLYSGNRNLMGPHHLIDFEEPKAVGPDSFELLGTWTDGVSSKERESYSFVRFGLFND